VRPYSFDLRVRMLADFDAGLTTQAVSEKYCVSTKCVRDLRRLRKETGQIAPRVGQSGPKPKLRDHGETLSRLVEEQPDATLEELQCKLPLRVSLSTLWRALRELGFSLKKSSACR
jgi:transposase